MKRASSLTITLIALLLGLPSLGGANYSSVSRSINSFVETLYPKGSHFFWVINDTTTDSDHEIVVDINTSLQGEANEKIDEYRFLLLLVDGELFAAQKIPLGAEVKCKREEQV